MKLTARTILEDVGGDRHVSVRVHDVEVIGSGLSLGATEPEKLAE